MNNFKRSIQKRRRIHNIAYHANRTQPSAELKQAIKALPVPPIEMDKRIRVKNLCLD